MITKKAFIIFLALVLLVIPVLTSCTKDDTTSDDVSSKSDESAASDGTPTQEEIEAYFKSYEGKFDSTIHILCIDAEARSHPYAEIQFVYDEEKQNNTINEAVKIRNDIIEERYGLKIKITAEKDPDIVYKQQIASGMCEFDIISESVDRMVNSVTDNLFIPLDDYINLKNPWWDYDPIDQITLSDKHYFLIGDAMITDKENTYLVLFNKDKYNNNAAVVDEYGDLYTMVREGKYTMDAFYSIAKQFNSPDSNGQWSFDASFGNLSHAYGSTIMVNGAGIPLAGKSADGDVIFYPGQQKSVEVFNKVFEIMTDSSVTQRAELIIRTSAYGFAELEEMFINNRGLFYNTTSSSLSILRGKTDFGVGVLPLPKYNEEQEDYFCAVSRYHVTVLGVPTTNTEKLDETMFLLEALGYYNQDVIKAYFETTLQLQIIDNDDDAEMLQLVYDSRFFDIGSIYNWGEVVGLYTSVILSGANTVTSKWEEMESLVRTQMEATVEQYNSMVR